MNKNARAGIKGAKTGGATAGGNRRWPKNVETRISTSSYQNHPGQSIAKLQIGTLLLALQRPLSQKQRKICWTLFETRFRDYVDQKLCKVQ